MNEYFKGLYFKSQNQKHTVALIPAMHISDKRPSASIQVITEKSAHNIRFPFEMYREEKDRIVIGNNRFSKDGLEISITSPDVKAEGRLQFGPLSKIKYDIMGPFRYVPFMECRHRVVSMAHTVDGTLQINGQNYDFKNARGYIEGDRGRSFPKRYLWTHCSFQNGSIMLSAAEIPMLKQKFTGILCPVFWQGKEYRLATYLGAKIEELEEKRIVIKQGEYRVTAQMLDKTGQALFAPSDGKMQRIIRENAACTAYYKFEKENKTLFEFYTDRASFECEW